MQRIGNELVDEKKRDAVAAASMTAAAQGGDRNHKSTQKVEASQMSGKRDLLSVLGEHLLSIC